MIKRIKSVAKKLGILATALTSLYNSNAQSIEEKVVLSPVLKDANGNVVHQISPEEEGYQLEILVSNDSLRSGEQTGGIMFNVAYSNTEVLSGLTPESYYDNDAFEGLDMEYSRNSVENDRCERFTQFNADPIKGIGWREGFSNVKNKVFAKYDFAITPCKEGEARVKIYNAKAYSQISANHPEKFQKVEAKPFGVAIVSPDSTNSVITLTSRPELENPIVYATAPQGKTVVIERSDSVDGKWIPVSTNTVPGIAAIYNTKGLRESREFYRSKIIQ